MSDPQVRAPLRVLHVVPTYYPAVRYGGPIYAVRGLVAALVACGHEVTVITTNRDGHGVIAAPTGQPVLLDGAKIHYCPAPHLARLNYSSALAWSVARSLRDADVLHLHSVFSFPTTVSARLAQRRGVPYLVAPRGALVPELVDKKSALVKRAWLRVFERDTLRRAARLHVTSRAEYEDADRLGLELPPAALVPNGVVAPPMDTTEPTPALRLVVGSAPFVLYLGRVSWKKGLDRLLRALRGNSLRLCIAGNDEEGLLPSLEALARELGVVERVAFVGHVEGSDKWWLLRSARVLALTSYNENFGNAVVEALAQGRPVVVSREVGAAEHVLAAQAGFVVDADGPELAERLSLLVRDAPLADALGRRGADYVRARLTWSGAASAMTEVYREVIRARQG